MKKFFLAAFLFATVAGNAQSRTMNSTSYQTALGVKIWDGGGITLKHFLASSKAVEGIAYFYNRGIRFTGLYEFHFDISGAPGLMWYVGPGAHIGFYNDKYRGENRAVLGIDGVLGLDYKFNTAPINLSLDWQPSIEFASGFGFNGNWGGLGIRYTF
jgi:hypothetical protein